MWANKSDHGVIDLSFNSDFFETGRWVFSDQQNHRVNPLTSMSDQERISLDIVSAISSTQVMRITKNRYKGILVDPIPNSPS